MSSSNDSFNFASLRLSQDFTEELAVKRKIIVVPVKKPDSSWWVRVNDSTAYQVEVACLQDRDEQRFYVLTPEIRVQMSDEAIHVRLYTGINRQGNIFLWPLRLPKDTQVNPRMVRYQESVSDAIHLAKKEWIRTKWNKNLGAYDVLHTERKLSEPVWPDEPFEELFKIAFKGFIIDSMEHPLIERLCHGA